MKATGFVRGMDDLGRVVIPKEIRRSLKIREGDPLEIFTDNEGEVIFKRYSYENDAKEILKDFEDCLDSINNYELKQELIKKAREIKVLLSESEAFMGK